MRRALALVLVLGALAPSTSAQVPPTAPEPEGTTWLAPRRVQALQVMVIRHLRRNGYRLRVVPVICASPARWRQLFPPRWYPTRPDGTATDHAVIVTAETCELGRDNWPPLGSVVELLTHENLHRLSDTGGAFAETTDAGRWWSEGAVQAATDDLVPRLLRRLWPWALYAGGGEPFGGDPHDATHARKATAVRAVSAAATGGPWWATAARRWRARFVRASIPGRLSMIDRTEQDGR